MNIRKDVLDQFYILAVVWMQYIMFFTQNRRVFSLMVDCVLHCVKSLSGVPGMFIILLFSFLS